MKWIGMIIAIFVAAGAAFMVLKFSGEDKKPQPQIAQPRPVQVSPQAAPTVETTDVYVASSDIPIGTVLQEHMLTTQPWPKHLLIDGFVAGPQAGKTLLGKVTRAPFNALEPIIKSKVANPEDPNFIAGSLPKGKRMITLKTDGISGLAGFVFPGDRVDVIILHRILREGTTQKDIDAAENEQELRRLTDNATEVLVSNVKVLATDQRASSDSEEEGVIIPKSVSLEVSPDEAQKIHFAQEIGVLSLALRSIKDKESMETVAITRRTDLSQFSMSAQSGGHEKTKVRVIRGVEGGDEEE